MYKTVPQLFKKGVMRTTIAIDKHVAERVASYGEKLGHQSVSAIAQLMLRKACDLIDLQGFEALINISSTQNITNEKMTSIR